MLSNCFIHLVPKEKMQHTDTWIVQYIHKARYISLHVQNAEKLSCIKSYDHKQMLQTDYNQPPDFFTNISKKCQCEHYDQAGGKCIQKNPSSKNAVKCASNRLEFQFTLVVDTLKTNSKLLHHRRIFHYLVNSIFINCAVILQRKYTIY